MNDVTKGEYDFYVEFMGYKPYHKTSLDQERPVSHIVRENYVQDSFTNVLGRNIVFSISWNFGKMNAARSNSARRAMANLMVQ